MLAPLRDYLRPRDLKSSPLLRATKDRYCDRLSVYSGIEEAQWIKSEDMNVENLLDTFASVDTDSEDIWDSCNDFMRHLKWYKPRQTVLRLKREGLPDGHHWKARCLLQLSRLSHSVGNNEERKRLLALTLTLEREQGDDDRVACTLRHLADANRMLAFVEEGIQQSKEALKIYERLGDTVGQARCLNCLARLLLGHDPESAEAAGTRAIDLLPQKGQEVLVCRFHRTLRGSPRNRIPVQLARSNVLDSSLSGGVVSR